MNIEIIAVFGGIGLACLLAYVLTRPTFREQENHGRSQFGGKNDRPAERKVDFLVR